MRPFTRHAGVAAQILRSNIDTDTIIPSVEMKTTSRTGLAGGLFASWRYLDREARTPDPDFVLNQPGFGNSSILLTGDNFGCGSSREHAVWALDEFGIRVIIAPSFGTIFYANCIANGLLPITLPWSLVQAIAKEVAAKQSQHTLLIDLEQRLITTASGLQYTFELPESDAALLLNGWDAIALTQQLAEPINRFRERDRELRPWAYLLPAK